MARSAVDWSSSGGRLVCFLWFFGPSSFLEGCSCKGRKKRGGKSYKNVFPSLQTHVAQFAQFVF